ncbi:hypothetical protein HDC94_002327 [Leifsonia sp. AK011]|uniref:hypothetical protein n=1 Tax=Leifsonia sp. AK011 TaxID=2723075 RepID=UPI0015C981ED|nr:hypothetical protein [Leifsonia sp. AK011]NYF11171.1 hypothetical protein [Leifsonia sp. AK011]
MKSYPKLGALVAVGALALALPLAGATAVSADEPIVVSIRAALDLPVNANSDGPVVFEVTDVTAGEGPELTEADLVENPSAWCGSVDVDVDPVSKTISIYTAPDSEVCNFQTVSVTITSDQIGAITLESDTLFDQSLCPDDEGDEPFTASNEVSVAAETVQLVDNGVWTFDYTSESGVVQLDWATVPYEEEGEVYPTSYNTCGVTVLTFAAPVVAAAPVEPKLAETGSENTLAAAALGAGVLLLGAAAVAAASVSRRTARD